MLLHSITQWKYNFQFVTITYTELSLLIFRIDLLIIFNCGIVSDIKNYCSQVRVLQKHSDYSMKKEKKSAVLNLTFMYNYVAMLLYLFWALLNSFIILITWIFKLLLIFFVQYSVIHYTAIYIRVRWRDNVYLVMCFMFFFS